MDANIVVLILGLAIIIVIAAVLLRGQKQGGRGEATFTLAELFSATVKFGAEDTESANEAAREAAKRQGKPLDAGPSVPSHPAARIARVLWVDDNPDNNLYETVALERLGRFVTKATSTDAGLEYLSQELGFTLVITDLGRRSEGPEAGITLIKRMQESDFKQPVVVYTINAERHREKVLAAGAKAVVDTPAELLHQVEAQLAS
jgi:CheY-like chemotaxis protein